MKSLFTLFFVFVLSISQLFAQKEATFHSAYLKAINCFTCTITQHIELFNKAVKLIPSEPEPSHLEEYHNAYFRLGEIYAEEKNYEKAQLNYEKAISFTPDNLRSKFLLYNVYFDQKKYVKSSDAYTILKDLIYQKIALMTNLGDANEVIYLEELLSKVYYNNGICYFYLRNEEKACIELLESKALGYSLASKAIESNCSLATLNKLKKAQK